MTQWYFYIVQNSVKLTSLRSNTGYTYAGVSPDPVRRLRQHNKELKGGAKYTISKAPGWSHMCIIEGFRTKIEAMQFEWAVRHAAPRNVGGVSSRIKKLYHVCCQEKWTSKAPFAKEVPLKIRWFIPIPKEHAPLPEYVKEFSEEVYPTLQ